MFGPTADIMSPARNIGLYADKRRCALSYRARTIQDTSGNQLGCLRNLPGRTPNTAICESIPHTGNHASRVTLIILRCSTCVFSLREQGVWMLYDALVYIYDTSTVKEDADGDVSCTKVRVVIFHMTKGPFHMTKGQLALTACCC